MKTRILTTFGLFLTCFTAIALTSFLIGDPNHLNDQTNHAGYLGAFWADFLFLHLGMTACLLPPLIAAASWSVYNQKIPAILSSLCLMAATCFYLECYVYQEFVARQFGVLPSTQGGWIGQELKYFLFFWLGALGSQVFVHLMFIHSLGILTGMSLTGVLQNIGGQLRVVCNVASSVLKKKTSHTGRVSKKSEKKPEYRRSQVQQIAWQEQDKELWSQQAQRLSEQLAKYGIENKVTAIVPGPVVVRFELQLAPQERSSKVVTLAKDLARSLMISHLHVIENIPGSASIGVEIAQQRRQSIALDPLLENIEPSFKLPLALGVQTQGQPLVSDLARLPHLLVAGSTGSGKSVGIAAMLLSLIQSNNPSKMRLILIDPKVLEFSKYEDIAHLALPIIDDHQHALAALNWCVELMESRYRLLAKCQVRHIEDYQRERIRRSHLPNMPYIVIVIDELADLMMLSKKAVEQPIARLAQKARACGIHLIIATQRPSVDIITGLIKANIPARLSYAVSSKIDSRTILDQGGGESLLGMGDGYFIQPGQPYKTRIHGAFVTDEHLEEVISPLRVDKPDYLGDLKHMIQELTSQE